MSQSLVETTAEYVRKQLCNEKTGHDWYHVYRVWQLAKKLQKIEGGDLQLIELSVLLHSAAEPNLKENNEKKRSLALWGMLDILELDEAMKNKIITISNQCRYKGAETEVPQTIEGKIVQDANWLDGLGAIGIARVFTAGGYYGRLIHSPETQPVFELNNSGYQKRKLTGTSLNYFFEKTFPVVGRLNTPTAKKIATKRLGFIKKYIEHFTDEWELNDF